MVWVFVVSGSLRLTRSHGGGLDQRRQVVRPLLVNLSSRRVVVIAALVSTLLLLAVSWTGWMDALELSLRMVMRSRPLPSGYFQVFIVAGTLLPLVLRTVFRRNVLVGGLLDPYLILLLGQIICELLMVLLVGPGLGVVVGFWFTVLRLLQLLQLRAQASAITWLQVVLTAEWLLWMTNAIQILVRRFLPLVVPDLLA